MQTTSVAIYQQLVPGISNVTLRMRYYGLYAWLTRTYAINVGDTSVEAWCRYLRRAEALYALAAVHAGGERGVAGVDWASRALSKVTGSEVTFQGGTDRADGEPQYLKQKFGAFGAAYGSQLVEVGLLEYVKEHDVPVPTARAGDGLAQAFNAAVGDAAAVFLSAVSRGSVSKSDLEHIAVMLPSKISASGLERRLYQELLFGTKQSLDTHVVARNLSLRLVLRTAQCMGRAVSVNDVRWALYASRTDAGEKFPALPPVEETHKFAWTIYQANDLLHVCYETLMKFALDVLGTSSSGMPLERLVQVVVSRLHAVLDTRDAETWAELLASVKLADDPWADDDELSEFSLQKAAFKGSPAAAMSTEGTAARAVLLLAVLHKRFGNLLARISTELPALSQTTFMQTILTELVFLQEHANEPLANLLARIVRRRVIDRHLWVAISKFRGQGDYTFLLESDDGRVRVRQKDGPVFTNPRLSSAIAFLQDIHLLGGNGPTSAGIELLEAP